MSKYNRINAPIEKAKEFSGISMGMEAHDESVLKDFDRSRKFNESMDKSLLQFGIDLFEHGYSLSDVRMDMELCAAMYENNRDYTGDKSMFSYDGVSSAPSFKKMLSVAKNPNLFMNIENGYNIAYRRALANNLTSNKDNKR